MGSGESIPEIRRHIKELVGRPAFDTNAYENCQVATLRKRVGDRWTESSYKKTIRIDTSEPAYELFYADYLRNFRGAGRPLFAAAERHYFKALKKLRQRAGPNSPPWDPITGSRVQRALIALYQEDGITAWSRRSDKETTDEIPLAFVASLNRFAQSTADLDRDVDDIRDYTSEALFSESRFRKNQPLSRDELKSLIRTKFPLETLARLRVRYGSMPSIDLFRTYRQAPNDAVTNFFVPDIFNGLILNSYGISAEKPFSFGRTFDADIGGTFKETRQKGLIEFSPTVSEVIRDYETKVAVSKFVGPDKVILQFNYAYLAIHPELANVPDRNREFTGAALTYQLLRPQGFRSSPYDRHFEIRGWDFFGGFLLDNEAFNDANAANNVTVIRRDYFAGVALKGMGRFDLTIQPTVFSSSSSNQAPASNSQYRTNATLIYRRIDEDRDRSPGLPETRHPLNVASWQLVMALRQDLAVHNLDAFENYKAGLKSDWKFFTVSGRTTILASLGYDFQRFYKLNKNENIFNVSLKVGF